MGTTVTNTTPLRLDEAVKLAFPQGGMTVSGLRTERARGRLVTEMIAGKEFTTLGDIERMRELCRSEAKARASGSNPQGQSATNAQSGSSETVEEKAARALLQEKLRQRSKSSPATSSPKPAPRRGSAIVTPIRSESST